MHVDKVKYFRNRLLQEKKALFKSKNNISDEEFGSMDLYHNELSSYDNHPADLGTEVFMKEQDLGFRLNLEDKIAEIDLSLQKIDEGTFGQCEKCAGEIDEERLELIPYAKTCIKCSKEETESVEFRQFESIEDEYATSFSNDESNVAYDREDSFQDAIMFNIVSGDPSITTGDNMGLMDEDEEDKENELENISQEYYEDTLK